MRKIKIAAGMDGSFDYGKVKQNMKKAMDAGCDYCHCDAVDMYEDRDNQIMGGHNIMYHVRKITDKPIECHFYSQECDLLFIEKLALVGCNMLILPAERFIGAQLVQIIRWCHEKNIKVGLTIGAFVPLNLIEEAIYEIDRLHIVTSDSKRVFRESSLDLISRSRKLIDEKNPKCELSVEGDIHPANVDSVVKCRPDVIVFSSAIFEDEEGITKGVEKCKRALEEVII